MQSGAFRAPRRRTPGRSALAVSCALGLACWAFAAGAQEGAAPSEDAAPSDATTLDTVRVTGIRASIATAVETKNESTSIVEAISAEDIGKLPDISIADSISRLPGLSTQRVDGRSQVINIRGMSEQFAGTLLNGREQVSTGDSRGVELDQYPAELINAVTVYKTPDAGLVGQGLSGTVDLQTVRPLSLDGRRIVFGGLAERNSLGDLSADGSDDGYRGSASYIDQFADDRFGIALGVARLSSPFQEEHYKQWWWASGDTTDGWGAPPQPGKPGDAIALQGSEGWIKSRDLQRDGIMGVFEFKPNDVFHSVLDLYHSRFEQDEVMHGTMWNNDPWFEGTDGGVTYSEPRTIEVDGVPVLVGGRMHGVQPVVRNDRNTREDRLFSAGWANTLRFDPWTFRLDLSYSRAEREQSQLELYAGRLGGQDVGFSIPTTSGFGRYDLPDLADPDAVYLWDPQNWGHDGRREDSWQTDTIRAGRLELNREVLSSDFLRSYDIGVHVNRRSKDKRADVYFADLRDGRTPVRVDPSLLMAPTGLGFLGIDGLLSFDPYDLIDRYYDVYLSETNDDQRKDFVVDEEVRTFFFRANLDMDLTDTVRLRGNAGVQYIRTDQSSTGFNASGGSPATAQTLATSYGDILPSLNLSADFGNGWVLRLAAAKTLMRPPINYLSADSSASVSPSTGEWSGSGGNPRLEPYRALAYDLSLEKYVGPATYFALAVFYKDLETYIYRQNIPWDFSGYDPQGETPISDFGVFSTWANGSGGYMRGVEFGMSLGGELLHPALDGFGLQANASWTQSSIDPDPLDDSVGTDTIPGLSKIVANATLYYEKHGVGVRLSQRYRDPYRGEYGALFGTRSYRFTQSENQLDLQLSYEFQPGSRLEGLSLLLQANNLTDTPFRTEVSEGGGSGLFLPEEYTRYGRQYMLGFRYALD
nr:TonB-dependent receptor [Luteimonas sp. Y-2-2-4F]